MEVELTLAGLMLFGRQVQRWRPAFHIKAEAFPGTSLADSRYLDSEDIGSTLSEQFKGAFAFIRRNLHHVQRGRGFNTLGELEIPEAALEELLVNALIHRDYFTSASVPEESPQIYPSPCACRCTSSHSRRSVATSTCRGSAPACRLRYSRPTRHTDRTAFVLTVLDW